MTISKHKTFFRQAISLNYLVLAVFLFIPSAVGFADVVSFLVDPDTIDSNNDGFITGDEFQPIGSGGTIFDFTPTNNLVSFPRFQLSSQRGLRYGGGGAVVSNLPFQPTRTFFLTCTPSLQVAQFLVTQPSPSKLVIPFFRTPTPRRVMGTHTALTQVPSQLAPVRNTRLR